MEEISLWKFENPNPTQKYRKNGKPYKWFKGDCAIRAFAIALDVNWLTAFNILTDIAKNNFDIPNSMTVIEIGLKKFGFTKQSCKVVKGEKRPTVNDLTQESKGKIFFLNVANHCVCAKDGYFYDTWDCGDLSVYTFWWKNIEKL